MCHDCAEGGGHKGGDCERNHKGVSYSRIVGRRNEEMTMSRNCFTATERLLLRLRVHLQNLMQVRTLCLFLGMRISRAFHSQVFSMISTSSARPPVHGRCSLLTALFLLYCTKLVSQRHPRACSTSLGVPTVRAGEGHLRVVLCDRHSELIQPIRVGQD